jgi:hypothetical protein
MDDLCGSGVIDSHRRCSAACRKAVFGDLRSAPQICPEVVRSIDEILSPYSYALWTTLKLRQRQNKKGSTSVKMGLSHLTFKPDLSPGRRGSQEGPFDGTPRLCYTLYSINIK